MDQLHLCRLCGKIEKELVNIFSKDCRGIQYINKIRKCIPILIYRTDPLSKFICEECSVDLNSFYQYQSEILSKHENAVENVRSLQQNKSTQLYLSTYDSSYFTVNENGHFDDEPEKKESKPNIKLLTPKKINEMYTNGNIKNNNENESKIKKILPMVYQPKTLFQIVLHNINLSINPTYQKECIPTAVKCNASRAKSRPRKKMLDEIMPLFNNLLRSQNLNIKKIKLEYTDPEEPDTSIMLRTPNSDSVMNSCDDLIITHAARKICKYCHKRLNNINELALHEQQHIHVFLGARIDSNYWRDYEENMYLRNKWINSNGEKESDYENDNNEDSQHYNGDVDDTETSIQNDEVNGNGSIENETIEEANTTENATEENGENENDSNEPKYPIEGTHVNGTPFPLIDKSERYKYYKEKYVNGMKRRVCPFCHNDYFNSNAVDYHIRKNRCIKMCQFCNLTYPRDDLNYYTHLNEHRDVPNFYKLTKFERKQYQDILKKRQREAAAAAATTSGTESENRVEPIKMKYLLQKQNCSMPVIKSEPNPDEPDAASLEYEAKRAENKPPRTFYCRKCYKVFYQQSELSEHFPKCYSDMGSSEDEEEEPVPMRRSVPMSMTHTYHQLQPQSSPIEKSESYPCHLCTRVFASSYSRNSHMRIHVNNPNYDAPFNHILNQNQVTITPVQKAIANRQAPPPPQPSKSIKYDENLARLAQNPQITIRPSVKKRPAEDSASEVPIPVKQIKVEPDDMRRYRCLPCGQYFSSKSVLYEHKKTCQRPTSNYVEMPVETKTSPEDYNKRFRCVPCNKRFSTNKALYFHKKSVCNRDKVFECPFCQRKFTTESQYTTHILYNHPE